MTEEISVQEAAQEPGIEIPALCDDEEIEPDFPNEIRFSLTSVVSFGEIEDEGSLEEFLLICYKNFVETAIRKINFLDYLKPVHN